MIEIATSETDLLTHGDIFLKRVLRPLWERRASDTWCQNSCVHIGQKWGLEPLYALS